MSRTDSEVISIRVPKGTREQLRLAACRVSLEKERDISWPSLIKDIIEKMLRDNAATKTKRS